MIGNDFTVGRRPTLQFRGDGRLDGNAGCTVYFGSAEISAAAIRFQSLQPGDDSSLYTSACDPLHLGQQARFLAALKSARQIRVLADRALLLDAHQKVLVHLEQREEVRESEGRMVSELTQEAHENAVEYPAPALRRDLRNDAVAELEFVALTPALGQYFGTDSGVLVTRARAPNVLELREGDVILSINGRNPANAPHALHILSGYPPGSTLELKIMRQRERLRGTVLYPRMC